MLSRSRVKLANNQRRGRSSLSVSRRTKDMLDLIKHEGQSYDGLIQELVKFWNEKRVTTGPGEEQRLKESVSSE